MISEGSKAATDGFDRAFARVQAAIDNGRIPGAALGLINPEAGRLVRTCGWAQKIGAERPLTRETWFDLASLSKVAFTTPRILKYAADGRIDLDAPLTSVIPDFRQYAPECWERAVTFRQCLGHQTPFPAVEPLYTYGDDPDRLRAFVLQREWRRGPPVYSDINFILLGIALERLEGKRIREMDAGPGFAFEAPADRTAATEHCMWRGRILCGEVHDENCYALQGSGHAGLFGNIDAVIDYAASLLEEDSAGSRVVRWMREPLSDTRTHGWERPNPGWSGGTRCNASVIGHTGFTGTGLWIDFDNRRAWTLLTNRVHPSRHFDSGIFALRTAVADAINQI